MVRGGKLLGQGADTCVYSPPVACQNGETPRDPSKYVSRVVTVADGDWERQTAIKSAIEKMTPADKALVSAHTVFGEFACTPRIRAQDLERSAGKPPCRHEALQSVGVKPDYLNILTPVQDADLLNKTTDQKFRALAGMLMAVVVMNSYYIVHGDAHTGNIAWKGDNVVLHDWGRSVPPNPEGTGFRAKFVELLAPSTQERFDTLMQYAQWYNGVELLRKIAIPTTAPKRPAFSAAKFRSDLPDSMKKYMPQASTPIKGSTPSTMEIEEEENVFTYDLNSPQLLRIMWAWDTLGILGSVESQAAAFGVKPDSIARAIRGVKRLTEDPSLTNSKSFRAALQAYVAEFIPTLRAMGGGARVATKFCKCIKAVRKTLKARKGSTPEQGAIAVCVKTVIQKKTGRTLKKFSCGKKARLVTQRRKLRGGYDPCEGYGDYDDKLRTEIYRAIRAGKNEDNLLDKVSQLSDEDINLPTCDGDYTLLDRAALSGMNRVADALLARGADKAASMSFLRQVASARDPAPETAAEQRNARAFLARLR